MPDDRDDLDDEAELVAWKLRELQRLKRDREVRRRFAASSLPQGTGAASE